MNCKGQFFSPDLVIALGVFLFSLALFWAASNAIFEQIDLFNSRIEADEISHSLVNSLVLSGGKPGTWENYSLNDINSFGLVHSNNILDVNKTVSLINLLNSDDYSSVKYKLGAGKYDLQLNIVDSSGNIFTTPSLLSGGQIVVEPVLKAVYTRVVYYNNESALLQAVISIED
ncbi:MAG: hypothetical protein PHD05_02200 [Sphaerochaetaceae bacterium]|nr:hypothetical protein [Sphaerochaetaceae bacterium]